jgi:hypothetical protein
MQLGEPLSQGISLRERLMRAGLSNEKEIRDRLNFAHAILSSHPSVNIKEFNPLENKG